MATATVFFLLLCHVALTLRSNTIIEAVNVPGTLVDVDLSETEKRSVGRRIPIINTINPTVARIFRFLSPLTNTDRGHETACNQIIQTVENAGPEFEYHLNSEINVFHSIGTTSTLFLENLQRLKFFVDSFEHYKNGGTSQDDINDFADSILDLGSDGLSQILFNVHNSIVPDDFPEHGSVLSTYESYRERVSAIYLNETIQFAIRLINLQTFGHSVGLWACNIKNNLSCFERFSNQLKNRLEEQDSFLDSNQIFAFGPPTIHMSFSWCSCSTCKPLIGDFDGNGKADILCYKEQGYTRLTTFDDDSGSFNDVNNIWHRVNQQCELENLYIGHFNTDTRSDVLCLQPNDRWNKIRLIYATSSGYLASSAGWEGTHSVVERCTSDTQNSKLIVGDFNGDRRTDIMCQNHRSGDIRITYRPTHPILSIWRWVLHWCRTRNTELFVGDFNGNGRSDLLCHDWTTGGSEIKFASRRGSFTSSVKWRGLSRFCQKTTSQTPHLYMGDFNGDGRSDILCYIYHANTVDNLKIAFSRSNGYFDNSNTFSMAFNWCGTSTARLRVVSDVNGDGRDDLICYDYRNQLQVSLNEMFLHFPN